MVKQTLQLGAPPHMGAEKGVYVTHDHWRTYPPFCQALNVVKEMQAVSCWTTCDSAHTFARWLAEVLPILGRELLYIVPLCLSYLFLTEKWWFYPGGCRGSIINNRDIETCCRYRTLKADALLIKSLSAGVQQILTIWDCLTWVEPTIRMSSDPLHNQSPVAPLVLVALFVGLVNKCGKSRCLPIYR